MLSLVLGPAKMLERLEALGTAQTRKIYGRHGVSEPMFGVSYAGLKTLVKQVKTDHTLAVGLWKSGNHDARVLATMIADPEQLSSRDLDAMVKDLDNYVLTDAYAALAGKTPHARKKMEKWTKSRQEWVGRTGWLLLAGLAMGYEDLPDAYFTPYLAIIETNVHTRKNRVRDAMNSALIAMGIRNQKLEKRALAAAKRIGKLDVDHGETSCKTPDATTYIQKVNARRKSKKR